MRKRKYYYYYYYDYDYDDDDYTTITTTTTTTNYDYEYYLLLLLLLLLPCTGCSPPCSFYHHPRRHCPLWVRSATLGLRSLFSSSLCLSACVWPIQSCTICAWRFLAARVLLTSRHGTAIFLTIIFALFCERVVHLHSSTQTRFLARNGLFFEFRFSPHGHRNPFPDEHSYELAKRKRQL